MDNRYKKFLEVVDSKNFSLAAKNLGVSQPAITLAIASLERELGTKLFLRKKTEVELTKDGEIVNDAAKNFYLLEYKMFNELGINTLGNKYKVGLIDSIAHLLYSSKPDIGALSNIEVKVDNSSRIIDEIMSGKMDAGIITGQSVILNKDIAVTKLHDEDFVFVRSANLSSKSNGNVVDNWLAFNQDSTTFNHFTKLFKRMGIRVTPVFYSTSMELLKEMAIAGKGTALLPLHLVKDSVAKKTLVIVRTKHMSRPIWVIIKKKNKSILLDTLAKKIDGLIIANSL
jgi:DNA-binding transcriptional LysR family regulator